MSSERPDVPPEEVPAKPATKWPRWRQSMLAGAVVLLLASIADAAIEDFPRVIYLIVFFTGYVFLSYGFFLAMSARRNPPAKKD
jgi:hypothetical protein